MELILELRAAEGGDDSKSLVSEFAQAYTKLFDRMGWSYI